MAKSKVFLFDDNEEILELCVEILQDLGCEVKFSPTTTDLLSQLEQFTPDLIFMDNWLPDISGVQATQMIKASEKFSHIPVVYFTANTNIESLARMAGADHYLEKPFDIEDFENLTLQALKKEK
ncbi:response regulator [Chryseobacterium sp. A321]